MHHGFNGLTGETSDDTVFSPFAIYKELLLARARIIKDRKSKEEFGDEMYQTIDIDLELVDKAEEFGLDSTCYWMRSTEPVPDHLKLKSVTTIFGDTQFDVIAWDKIGTYANSRIKSARDKSFVSFRTKGKDTYLYLHNNEKLKKVSMTAIFEDPYEAEAFNDDYILCHPYEASFHTDNHLIDSVVKLSLDTILKARAASQAYTDTYNNDGLDAPSAQGSAIRQ